MLLMALQMNALSLIMKNTQFTLIGNLQEIQPTHCLQDMARQ